MLKKLHIRNYALIDELTAQFAAGLTIITGETGTGKSIIVDALGLVLGDRAAGEVVRTGAEKAVVEAVFDVDGNKKLAGLLREHELECPDELIVRREVSVRGQSRCFVSDSPVTLQVLRHVGDLLVDLHGQHEHQSLLRRETHIEVVDEFGCLGGDVDEFRESRSRLLALAAQLGELRTKELHLREKRELYEFQVKEIDAVSPQEGEEEQLDRELVIMENAEKLYAATGNLYELLYDAEQSVHDRLALARSQLEALAAIDPSLESAATECSSAQAIVGELARVLQQYNSRVEFNPARLEEIRNRLGLLSALKRKYGGTIASVLTHRETIGRDVAFAENVTQLIQRLIAEVEAQRKACAALALKLSGTRKAIAQKLDKAIIGELARLGMPGARFTTHLSHQELDGGSAEEDYIVQGKTRLGLTPCGIDTVEFHISANPGEDLRPLAKVASGGEISRIMLAMKSILARSERLPVMVFDEIDVGVSGRVAQAVGMSLKQLAEGHQVIAITHLPQIAGMADAHFVVEKHDDGERTRTAMRALTKEERVHEIAKLMSGAEVTAAGLKGARELMRAAENR